MITIVFDHRPDYLSGEAASLLTLPAGPRSLLDHMAAGLGLGTHDAVTIVAAMPRSAAYVRRLSRNTKRHVTVIGPNEIASHLSEGELQDYVCVADAGHWPVNGFMLNDVLESYSDYRGAKHVVAIGENGDRAWEQISHNSDGLVTGVYDQSARVAIIDLTGTKVTSSREKDEEALGILARAFQSVRLLGVHVVITGMQANLATRLTESDVDLAGVATEPTMQMGIDRAASILRGNK